MTNPPKQPSARNLSLDLLKGVSIILVVFFHNLRLNPDSFADNLWMLACNAAVPCFFLASGAVFFQRPFQMKHHILRIIRTYAVLAAWRGIYLLFYGIHLGAGAGGSLRAFLSYMLTFTSIDGIPTGHLWFMEALIVVLLLAPILRLCREHSRPATLYLMAVLFFFNQLLNDGQFAVTLLSQWAGRSVWNITTMGQINPVNNLYSNYVLYFLLGAELTEQRDRFLVKTSSQTQGTDDSRKSPFLSARILVPVAMMAAGLTGMVLIKYLQSGTFLWRDTHIVSGYYWISTMLLACGMFLTACLIPVNSIPALRLFSKTVGAATLGIFYLHMILFTLLDTRILTPLNPWNGWLLNLLESCLIAAIACGISLIGKKIPLARFLF